jgi:hypothetical protein
MSEIVATLLGWQPYQIVLFSLLIAGVIPFLSLLVVYLLSKKGLLSYVDGFHSTNINAIAILFSLFSAFVANDIWIRLEAARSAVIHEADGIQLMMRLTEGLSAGETKFMYNALKAHVKTAVEDEWGQMEQGKSSEKAVQSLSNIVEAIVTFEVGKNEGPEFQGRLLATFIQIRDNWRIRTEIAKDRSFTIKWFGMIIFGFLTQIAIACAHASKPKSMFIAQTIFALAFATPISLLIMNEFPFSHMTPISSEPLQTAIELKNTR